MRRTLPRSPGLLSLTLAAVLTLTTACSDGVRPTGPAPLASITRTAGNPAPNIHSQIAHLRAATAPFRDFQTASDAGYSTQITGCFSGPDGGMGYHYGNVALIDGVVDALKPELLLYEPQQNGTLRFVAVEYIVPFDAWTGAEPPQLYGQTLERNEVFGIWALHVWSALHNPNGLFADWNPGVSCP